MFLDLHSLYIKLFQQELKERETQVLSTLRQGPPRLHHLSVTRGSKLVVLQENTTDAKTTFDGTKDVYASPKLHHFMIQMSFATEIILCTKNVDQKAMNCHILV